MYLVGLIINSAFLLSYYIPMPLFLFISDSTKDSPFIGSLYSDCSVTNSSSDSDLFDCVTSFESSSFNIFKFALYNGGFNAYFFSS